MSDELADSIEEAASKPLEVSSDGHTVKMRPLAEQLEADKYLDARAAARKRHGGIKITKIVPPGAP